MSFNTTPILPGQPNGGSDTALYLKMFAGEVLTTFREKNKLLPLTRSKYIGAGRSHQFPVVGQADANYHVRGQNIMDPANGYLSGFEHAERTIQPDKTLLASFFTDDWESKITHYDMRGEYAAQLGEALARRMDQQMFRLMALAARSAASLPATQAATKSGTVITKANSATSVTEIIEALVEGATAFAEKDIPEGQVHFFLKPAMYYQLASQGDLINRDFTNMNGDRATGMTLKGWGFQLHHTNNMPSTIVAADVGENNVYAGDFTTTQAIGFHTDAIATVIREDIKTETERKPEFQGDLVISGIKCGHGILRPECAIEVVTA